jgi:Tfp pilus assembly protein PilV
MLMTRLRNAMHLLAPEGGFALPLALAVVVVLGISVTSMIQYTSANSRTSSISKNRNEAYHLAEAGINNAINVIRNSDTPMFATLLPARTTTYDTGSVTWSGTLDETSPNVSCPTHLACWNITSIGFARNPTGGLPLRRSMRINVPLDAVYTQRLVNDVYEYVFVYGTGDASGCDFNNSNNTTFDSPLYIQGNLCISNSTAITNELHVWGTAALNSPGSIGQKSGSTITYDTAGVHIKNGCGTSSAGPFTLNCGDPQRVWANPFDNSPRTLTAPNVLASAQGWYKAASPGPYFPCKTSSGLPSNTSNWATAFDGDQGSTPDYSHMNRSVTGAFNLTPSSAYSCKTTLGELSYDPNAVVGGTTVPTLTVRGTVFIDGNARIAPSNKPMIRVVGVGTIYVSGSMVITGTNVCAAYSGSNCDWSLPGSGHWDVSQNFLAIVAGVIGGGGQSETSDSTISIALRSCGFQGELTAMNRTEVSQASTTQGPLVQRGMVLSNSLRTYRFGSLSDVPTATPDNSITSVTIASPSGFSG